MRVDDVAEPEDETAEHHLRARNQHASDGRARTREAARADDDVGASIERRQKPCRFADRRRLIHVGHQHDLAGRGEHAVDGCARFSAVRVPQHTEPRMPIRERLRARRRVVRAAIVHDDDFVGEAQFVETGGHARQHAVGDVERLVVRRNDH